MATTTFDFSTLARAGVSQEEFSKIIGVTRVTVNLWVRGKMNPNRFVKGEVLSILLKLQMAVDAGLLPVEKMKRGTERRLQKIEAAIEQVSAQVTVLTEAPPQFAPVAA